MTINEITLTNVVRIRNQEQQDKMLELINKSDRKPFLIEDKFVKKYRRVTACHGFKSDSDLSISAISNPKRKTITEFDDFIANLNKE